jgi:uncharacterized protein DUF3551
MPAIVIGAVWLAPLNAYAQARDYPFCAHGGKTSEGVSCDFATLAQCQATTAGSGGSCIANPKVGRGAPRATDASPATRR